jgi:hypothetical protein
LDPQEEVRIKSAALTFKEVFGAVPGADVQGLEGCLAEGYACQVRSSSRGLSRSSMAIRRGTAAVTAGLTEALLGAAWAGVGGRLAAAAAGAKQEQDQRH